MHEILAYYGPAALTFLAIVLFALALVIKAWRDGSLKSDLKWVRSYVRLHINHMKKTYFSTN